jgi:recombinational DNA repair protein RecT
MPVVTRLFDYEKYLFAHLAMRAALSFMSTCTKEELQAAVDEDNERRRKKSITPLSDPSTWPIFLEEEPSNVEPEGPQFKCDKAERPAGNPNGSSAKKL